jgi:methylenetetrahydrofolate dehydrogenase (NADP+)/methenyltetrahydrofolate cyclohydrolase
MSTPIIDGRALARTIRKEVKAEIAAQGLHPLLAVVLIGDNPASEAYVAHKTRVCQKIGIQTRIVRESTAITEQALFRLLDALNADRNVHGILVQLPLPGHISTADITEAINPKKDVDGFHALNVGRLTMFSQEKYFHPCTPLGIVKILKHRFGQNGFVGKKAVVIGQSMIVGRPTAIMLQNEFATVTMCDKHTRDLKKELAGAEIVVTATGVPHLITADLISDCAPDVVVIDAGFSKVDGKLTGDVDFEGVKSRVGAVTPVPGGVGPMTVAVLTRNVLKAARLARRD